MKKQLLLLFTALFITSVINAQCYGRFYEGSQIQEEFESQFRDTKFADLDSDGDIDQFIIEAGKSNKVRFNDGNGNFFDSGQNLGAYYSENLALEDLDGDGDIDAVVLNENYYNKIWFNNGNGYFTYSENFGDLNSNQYHLATADFDNDGDIDIVLENSDYNGSNYISYVTIYLNDGMGHLTASNQDVLNNYNIREIHVIDIDNDGDSDIYTHNYGLIDTVNGGYITTDSVDKLLINDGNGIFTINDLNFDIYYPKIVDLDGDNDLDIFSLYNNFDSTENYLNDGNGNFTKSENITYLNQYDIYEFELVDVDNDNLTDMIFTTHQNDNNYITTLKNNGNGIFIFYRNSNVSWVQSDNIHINYFNADSLIDVYIHGMDAVRTYIYFNGVSLNTNSSPTSCINQCNGTANVSITNGVAPYSFEWDDPLSQTTSIATELCPGNYQVSVTDSLGCNLTGSVTVSQTTLPSLPLCLVSVDSTSIRNVIVWEKPISSAIDHFNIYRELSTGAYSVIGSVDYDSLSQFTDNTLGINPNVTSYRYKLAYVDTCGNESELSDYHETMHLSTNLAPNGGINLIWDGYEGIPVSYYRILRDSGYNNNWQVMDSVTNNVFIWSDINPPVNGAQYLIEVVIPYTCTSTRSVDHNTSRSNRGTVAGGGNAPLANFSANSTQINSGAQINFYDQSSNNPDAWIWYFPGGSPGFSNLVNPTNITYNNPGVYEVKLIVQNTLGLDTLVKQDYIEVFEGTGLVPNCEFVASTTQILVGDSVAFLDLTANNPTSWKWLFPGGNPAFSLAQNPSGIIYSDPGIYDVTLVSTNVNGTDSLRKVEHIEVTSTIGNIEKQKIDVNIYPNPTQSSFIIDLKQLTTPFELTIKDISGRYLLQTKLDNNKTEININDYSNGIYFIELINSELKHKMKIIKN
jgi:PKD repeat protein